MYFLTLFVICLSIILFRSHWLQILLFQFLTQKRGTTWPNKIWWKITRWISIDPTGTSLVNNIQHSHQQKDLPNDSDACLRQHFYVCQLFFTRRLFIAQLQDWLSIINHDNFKFIQPSIKSYFDSPSNQLKFYQEVFRPGNYDKLLEPIADNIPNPTKFNYNDFRKFGNKCAIEIVYGFHGTMNGYKEHQDNVLKQVEALEINKGVGASMSRDYIKTVHFLLNSGKSSSSLLKLTCESGQLISCEKLASLFIDWYVFIYEIIVNSFPRLLVMLSNHPIIFNRIAQEISSTRDTSSYRILRRCILESQRLHPTRLTSTVKAMASYPSLSVRQSEQIVSITSQFLRDGAKFQFPNQFIPDRWSNMVIREESYVNIMWDLSPSQTEMKELAISLLQVLTKGYLKATQYCVKNIAEPKLYNILPWNS